MGLAAELRLANVSVAETTGVIELRLPDGALARDALPTLKLESVYNMWIRRSIITSKVFVGNMSYDTTRGELETIFSEIGEIVEIFVPTDRVTGRPRGFAFVEFTEQDSAEQANRAFRWPRAFRKESSCQRGRGKTTASVRIFRWRRAGCTSRTARWWW